MGRLLQRWSGGLFRTLLKGPREFLQRREWVRARNENRLFVSEFPYLMRTRPFETTIGGRRIAAILDSAGDSVSGWLKAIEEFLPELARIPNTADEDDETPNWHNWYLPALDGMLLYTLVRKLDPKTYLEVGSGFSTKFVRLAIRDGGLRTRIVSIDSAPRAAIDALSDETIRMPLESIDADYYAKSLSAGDIVFVDCSHRSFPNSDVTVFFTEVLPALPAGVIYGIHDIYLPLDYPAEYVGRFYNEQYLLASYLLGGHAGDELVFPGVGVSNDPQYCGHHQRLVCRRWIGGTRTPCRSLLDEACESFALARPLSTLRR
jgi:predicted O-methyltransferase YrrM